MAEPEEIQKGYRQQKRRTYDTEPEQWVRKPVVRVGEAGCRKIRPDTAHHRTTASPRKIRLKQSNVNRIALFGCRLAQLRHRLLLVRLTQSTERRTLTIPPNSVPNPTRIAVHDLEPRD